MKTSVTLVVDHRRIEFSIGDRLKAHALNRDNFGEVTDILDDHIVMDVEPDASFKGGLMIVSFNEIRGLAPQEQK